MQLVDELLFHSQSAHTFNGKHRPINPCIVDFRELFHEVCNDSQRVRGYIKAAGCLIEGTAESVMQRLQTAVERSLAES